jgi:hypothetical protein
VVTNCGVLGHSARTTSSSPAASGDDIVGVQESSGNLTAIADALGWDYAYEPIQIISRFPIVVPGGDPDFVYVELAADEVVAVSNVHVQAFPYGPYDLRDGATVDQVLANETQFHMQQMASRFASLPAPGIRCAARPTWARHVL